MMRAVVIEQYGGPENLQLKEVPRPELPEDELLVKVAFAGVNRADIMQRKGLYPPPPGVSEIPGLEVAGTVVACGKKCSDWKVGERVFGLLAGGGYAEYVTIHKDMAWRIPEEMAFFEAAAIPEAFLTAFQALVWIARLREGETVLVHAGGSGVGTAAIQIARSVGANVGVTAGSEEKLRRCRQLGANWAINYKAGPFTARLLKETDGRGVDVVVDFIGKAYFEQNLEVLKTDGRLVFLAMMSGSVVEQLDLKVLMKKRLQITGSTLRNRSLAYKIELAQDFARWALPLFEDKQMKPVIDKIFPAELAAEAHRYMEANLNFGKILLQFE
ncbi:MAG: NAD(P)H-quinone oxidoreductase [Calditrichia bacterium]